jgi:release factor glutamine methyltransferase
LCRSTTGLEAPRILDLCTGTGCIAMALAKHLPAAVIIATDIDPSAIEVATQNAKRLELAPRITYLQGNLYEALASAVDAAPFHLIVSNPPYIPSNQIPKLDRNVRDFEPIKALDGGPDGLSFHRRILQGAAAHLLPGGRVMMEIAFDQAEPAVNMASGFKEFSPVRILKDASGNDRVLTCVLASA